MKKLIYLFLIILVSSKSFAQTITVSGASDHAVNHAFVFDITHNHYHYIDNSLKDYFFNDAGNVWIIYNLCNGCTTEQTLYVITSPGAIDPPCYGIWAKATGTYATELLSISGSCFQNPDNRNFFVGDDLIEISQVKNENTTIKMVSNEGNIVSGLPFNVRLNGSNGGSGATMIYMEGK